VFLPDDLFWWFVPCRRTLGELRKRRLTLCTFFGSLVWLTLLVTCVEAAS